MRRTGQIPPGFWHRLMSAFHPKLPLALGGIFRRCTPLEKARVATTAPPSLAVFFE
jgi:hypothetical protein